MHCLYHSILVSNVLHDNTAETQRACRKPEIMADAAYLALAKPSRQFTGRFLVDDTFLTEEGLKPKDLLEYSYDPSEFLSVWYRFVVIDLKSRQILNSCIQEKVQD